MKNFRPASDYFRKTALTGLAALALAAISPVTASAATLQSRTGLEAPSLSARYTIYVGGFLFAHGDLDARLAGDGYKMRALITVAGMPSAFFDSKWDLTSQGRLSNGRVRPVHYVFNSIEKDQTKKTMLDYDAQGTPRLTMDPPQDVKDKVHAFERRNTQDPMSTFLLPVKADGTNPCERTTAIFDGKRRYDLQFSFDREDVITTRNKGYSGKALVCTITFKPGTGTERKKFTSMLRTNRDTKIWLAPMDGGRVYLPVKLVVSTPLGGAVMEVTSLQQITQQAKADTVTTK